MNQICIESDIYSKNKIAKFLLVFFLLSADISKLINIGNINFFFVLIISTYLIIVNYNNNRLTFRFSKNELPIYLSALLLSSSIILLSKNVQNIIHGVKLMLIFFMIYPTIRSFYTKVQLLSLLTVNVAANFLLILGGKIVSDTLSRETGFLRGSTILNYAGSLYKVGLLVLPFVVWNLIKNNDNKSKNLILLILSIYIISFDGSRTGFISVILILTIYLINIIWNILRGLKFTLKSIIKIFIFIIIISILSIFYYQKLLDTNSVKRGLETINLFFKLNFDNFLVQADPVRGQMILDSISKIKNYSFLIGQGFGTTTTNGIVIHNAYLQVFADLGIFPFICLLILIIYPIAFGFQKIKYDNSMLPTILLLLVFSFIISLHPLSVQPTDWSFYLIPLSILMDNSNSNSIQLETNRYVNGN